MDPEILKNLKDGPEQQLVVGPLVEFLVDYKKTCNHINK